MGVGAFILTNVFGAAAFAATTAGAIASIAIDLALTTLVSAGIARLQAQQLEDGRQIATLNIRSASHPKNGIFGTALVGSLVAYANQKLDAGTNHRYSLWLVDVHAAHQCEDIVDLYLDDVIVTDADDIDWGNNRVDGGDYGITAGGVYAVNPYKELGTSSQSAIADLVSEFTEWTTAHQGRGLCYSATRFVRFNQSEEIFAAGPPASRRWLIKGANEIYDPRLDTAPGADPTNAAYQAWTDNPVLCICHLLRTYGGVDDDRIDWTFNASEADTCDVLIEIPPAASPANTIKRYTCNGVFSFSDSFEDVLHALESSAMARTHRVNGKWRVYVGAYHAATVTLDESDVFGAVTEETNFSHSDRYNSVRGVYVNADEMYEETSFFPVSVSTFVTRDGGKVYWRDIELPFTTNEYQAQNIAYKYALQSDQKLVLTVPLRWTGLKCFPGVSVTFSYGPYSSKVFRCVGWKKGGGDAPFTVVLREDSSSAWDDLAVGAYTTRSAAGEIVKGDTGPPAPTGLTATSGLGGNLVQWSNPLIAAFNFVRVYASASSAWAGASVVFEGNATEFFHEVTAQRWYWVLSVRDGVESLREPDSDTSTITATPTAIGGLAGADTVDFATGVVGAEKPENNATVGAAWATNLSGRPTELTDGRVSAGLDASGDVNRTVPDARVASSSVTQHQGDINALSLTNAPADAGATLGAAWGTNLSGRPTELTDGRVSAGLDASGDLNRNIGSSRADSSNLLRYTSGGLYTGSLAATQNTGALADQDTVGQFDIDSYAVVRSSIATNTGKSLSSGYTEIETVDLTLPGTLTGSLVLVEITYSLVVDNTTQTGTTQLTLTPQTRLLDDDDSVVGSSVPNDVMMVRVNTTGNVALKGTAQITVNFLVPSANLNASQVNTFKAQVASVVGFYTAAVTGVVMRATLLNRAED